MKSMGLVLLCGVVLVCLVGALSFFIIRLRARTYVLAHVGEFIKKCYALQNVVGHRSVSERCVREFGNLERAFEPFRMLNQNSRRVSWIQTQEALDKLLDDLDFLEADMKREIEGGGRSVQGDTQICNCGS